MNQINARLRITAESARSENALGRNATQDEVTNNEAALANGYTIAGLKYNVLQTAEAHTWESTLLETALSSPTEENEIYTAYYDSLGVLTVGIGHKVQPSDNIAIGQTITDAQINAFYAADSAKALAAAQQQAAQANILSSHFVEALADADFQLGNFVTKNPNTWNQIVNGDYGDAAYSLNVGPWIQQTPIRVANFQNALQSLPGKGT